MKGASLGGSVNDEIRYGDWIEEKLLGEGTFAEVHRARHATNGQRAALKVLREEWRKRYALRERFKDEAQTSELIGQGAMRIPSLPAFFGSDTDGDVPWIAVEFIEGKPLDAVLTEGTLPDGRLMPRDTVGRVTFTRDVGIAIAEALAYTHRRGIVHRDIKPENVLCSGDGRFVVIDFGIARDARGRRHTREDMPSPMTPEYASPEQLESRVDESLETALDAYALGCILYELLTGELPPVGTATTKAGSVWVPRSQPLDVGQRAPGALRDLILQCTQGNPALRPSMGAISSMLKDIEPDAAVGASVGGIPGGGGRGSTAGLTAMAVDTNPPEAGRAGYAPTIQPNDPTSGTLWVDDDAPAPPPAAPPQAPPAAAPPAAHAAPPAAHAAPPPAHAGPPPGAPPGHAPPLAASGYPPPPVDADWPARKPFPWLPVVGGVGILLLLAVIALLLSQQPAEVPIPPAPTVAEQVEEPAVAEPAAPAEPAAAPARADKPAPRVVTPPPADKPAKTEPVKPEPAEPEPVKPAPEPAAPPPEPPKPLDDYGSTGGDFPPKTDAAFLQYAATTARQGDRTAFQELADYMAANPAEVKAVLTPATAQKIVKASMSFDRLPYPKNGAQDVIASYLPSLGDNLTCDEVKTWLRWTYGRRAGSPTSSDFYKKWCVTCTARYPDADVDGATCSGMAGHRWINGRCVNVVVELFPKECPS